MKRLYFAILLQLPLLFIAADAFARAGGGGGHGKGSIWGLILLPFIYFMHWLIRKRSSMRDSKISSQLGSMAQHEAYWSEHNLRARVEKTFFATQNAWMMRDQNLAKEYMSDRLYQKHKMQTDMMLQNNTQNMLDNINLIDIKLVSIDNQAGDARDSFVAYIEGSMVDYTIDLKTGTITDNPEKTNNKFQEFWSFIIQNGNWVLDEIDQNAEWSDFKRFKIQS